MGEPQWGSLSFDEMMAFFRDKLDLGTADWTQIWQEAHDVAFTVAGATELDLVADIRDAIDQAITDGTGLRQFRKDFAGIIDKYGWSYKGGFGWRSRVIYDTNLSTAFAAGRWQQLQAVKEEHPYWQYVHDPAVIFPRPQHLAWNGLVLPADSPWWNVHYPPNGWGCKCSVRSFSRADVDRMGLSIGTAPDTTWRQVTVGARGQHPRQVWTPEGVDPGFAYAPGRLADLIRHGALDALKQAAERMGVDWRQYGRP